MIQAIDVSSITPDKMRFSWPQTRDLMDQGMTLAGLKLKQSSDFPLETWDDVREARNDERTSAFTLIWLAARAAPRLPWHAASQCS